MKDVRGQGPRPDLVSVLGLLHGLRRDSADMQYVARPYVLVGESNAVEMRDGMCQLLTQLNATSQRRARCLFQAIGEELAQAVSWCCEDELALS